MRAPLLLDTCACLWLLAGTLSAAPLAALTEAFNTGTATYVSPITALEVGTLARKGRFRSHLSPQRWFESLLAMPRTMLAAMPPELLLESALLPGGIQGDPYDRIIAATARTYGYTVMTSDQGLRDYAKDGYLSVLEC